LQDPHKAIGLSLIDSGDSSHPASTLQRAFQSNSPRFTGAGTTWPSALIHASVWLAWLALLAMTLRMSGLRAWGVGVAYVVYDTVLLLFVAWQTLPLLRSRPPPPIATERRVSLGVIVAAYNESAVLPEALAGLLNQSDALDLIVIADDGSTDDTARLLETRFGIDAPALGTLSVPGRLHPTLRWLRLPHRGKAAALNEALLAVDCDVVLTVDADTPLDRQAVSAMRHAFAAEPMLVAATGVLAPTCPSTLRGRCFQWFQTYEYIRNFLSRYAWMRLDGLLLISGAFAGFRTQAVRDVGGFDTDCLVEDYELIHRMHRHAESHALPWRIRVIGAAQAHTDAPSSVAAFLRQRRRWFGGFLQTQYWYRDMVGDRRHGWLGLLMLPVKAVDTVQPLYGLAAFGLLVTYLVRGDLGVLLPVAGVIGIKITIDLIFHLWSVHLYRRWLGRANEASLWQALLAALVEPFSFQLLRHSGAALGWWVFISGRSSWGRAARSGTGSVARSSPPPG
jgi:glycosyltransferase involved in cell wall biosynthesis